MALRAPSLQSLLESDRGSNDSLLTESLQLDINELDEEEFLLPHIDTIPSLESILSEMDTDSIISDAEERTPSTASINECLKTGTMLRQVVLQGVSSQIASASDRINCGSATSVAVNDMISIGTSHGYILVFDVLQTLRWCSQDHSQHGAVASLAFNDSNTRLLAGFAGGLIVMIDATSGDTIRTLTDVITPNSGVLNLKWTGKSSLAICSDSGGSVWSFSFTRRLGKRGCDSRCLFSGARGEVCAIEPLVIDEEDHPLRTYCVVALATLSKFFVVIIRPRLKVIKFHPLQGPPDSLPLIAWQMVLIQSSDSTRTVDPVLAAARGSNVYFHQIFYQAGKINLIFLRHIQMSYDLLSLHWMGPRTLAAIERNEILHLMDVRTAKELECIDVADGGMVFASANFKGFATGGNVSPALALAGTRACYNSVVSRGSKLYILGARSIQSISVRSWSDRINHLIQNQRWCEACSVAIEGYRNASDRPRRKQIAKDRIIQLVDEYLAASAKCPELCLGSIMACLIEIQELDILWQDLWDRLDKTDTYLILLSEQIEKGTISIVSPVIAQSLCEYWLKNSTETLEEIILKLDWKCLDLHQVLSAAKAEKLYIAQIYLYTKALNDYCLPLIELIPQIKKQIDRNLGNNILVYVSSCLSGRGYPTGQISGENVQGVKHEVWRCLTSFHSNRASDQELPYPYLRALLEFDTRETINVISIAFQEKEFSGELGQSHRQRIINILLCIMEPAYFEWSNIGCLMNFIAQEITTQSLPEEPMLLQKVMDYFKMDFQDETIRQHTERENAWIELFDSDRINCMGLGDILELANSAKCFRVVQHILEKQRSYDKILNCFICDIGRREEMWAYIRLNIHEPDKQIFVQFVNNFEQLLHIDAITATRIVIDYYLPEVERFIQIVEKEEKIYLVFVQTLLQHNVSIDQTDFEKFLGKMCIYHPENIYKLLREHENYRIDSAFKIMQEYKLYDCMIYLQEKRGDFEAAFDLSLNFLKDAPESTAEMRALELSALCGRASKQLGDRDREKLWFTLTRTVLLRHDLTSVTRNILHAAGAHVNLSNLIQLVLNSETRTGNFGDIKHLIIGMLANSKYETLLLQTTFRIFGKDLNEKLSKGKQIADKGLSVKYIKCIVCRFHLYNQQKVLVFGLCGHGMHTNCVPEEFTAKEDYISKCPRCNLILNATMPIQLARPNEKLFDTDQNLYIKCMSEALQLQAPPRIFTKN